MPVVVRAARVTTGLCMSMGRRCLLSLQGFEQSKRQILDRVDLVDLVSEHVALRRRGRRLVGLCPFHSEKTPSFTVNPDMGIFKCFGCGKGGDLFSFVQQRENVSFMEAMRILADRAGIELSLSGKSENNSAVGRADIAKVNDWAARWFRGHLLDGRLGATTRTYVADRGIADEVAEQFELGLAIDGAPSIVDAGRRAGFGVALLEAADLIRRREDGRPYETFRNRLIFPIRDPMRRVIGFGGRTLVDDRAKYLNTRQNALFDKGRSLYGIDRARESVVSAGRVVIVEGYTDCIAAHQAGFPETVATLGTALTDQHVDLLRRYTEQAVFLFDSDSAGTAAADRAITVALPRCLDARLARIPEGKDPSDFLGTHDASAFSDVLNGAVGALEFKWLQIENSFRDRASDATRREAILEFLRIVAEGADGHAVDAIQRGLMVNQVAHLLRMGRAEVEATLSRLAPRRSSSREAVANVPQTAPERALGEQRDWARVLEVVLSEPGLLAAVGELPDVGRIIDPRDRRIAEVALDLADRYGEFRMVDVLSALSDPQTVERACDLAERGSSRTRHETELRDALSRIGRRIAAADLEDAKRTVREAGEEAAVLTGGSPVGAALQEGLEAHRHFVPQRLRRRAGGDIGG